MDGSAGRVQLQRLLAGLQRLIGLTRLELSERLEEQFENLIRWVYDRMITGEFYKQFPGAAMHEDKEEDDGE